MKFIYVMDPLCGWCYGNYPQKIRLAEHYKNIPFEVIPAGMWTGINARHQSKQMADYFLKHDWKIEQVTGTVFGKAYQEFINRTDVLLDSEVPSRAIVVVHQYWPEKQLKFAIEVQKARYLYGKDLNTLQTYLDICQELNIDAETFTGHFNSKQMVVATQDAFERAATYAFAYPTLLLEQNGETTLIEQGYAAIEEVVDRVDALESKINP